VHGLCESGACRPGDLTPCGFDGGGCVQTCQTDGTLGQCQPPSGQPVNLQNDVNNCGQCGEVCPLPLHASPLCANGVCGRGPCQAGYFDIDGNATFGCEATCQGQVCTLPDGGTVVVNGTVLPEAGLFSALASGSSFGGAVQTSASFTNMAVLGESTPPPLDGGLVQTSPSYRNYVGVNAAQKP
jgi:hypothetical protein